jgi:hypothetical protein
VSDNEHQPEAVVAFEELEQLVRHLGDELASFRKRALLAETRLKELEVEAGDASAPSSAEVRKLERENAALKTRLEAATARTREMLERVRFLRQQQARGVER